MKLISTVLWLAAVGILAVAVSSCGSNSTPGNDPRSSRAADEAAIRDLISTNMVAANKHDAAGVAATYSLDADLIAFAGGQISGRDAIIQHEKTFFDGAPEVGVSTKIESVRFVSPDVAVVENTTVHTFPRATSERATLVVARDQGHWLIQAVRVLPAQERADMFSSDLLPKSTSDPTKNR